MDSPDSSDIESTKTPFLLKLFYRTGTFHRPDEFAADVLPPHLPIHTYTTATLLELAHHIAALDPAALPSPAIGTRLSFRLIYPDTAAPYPAQSFPLDHVPAPRYLSKDLGSLVLGEGGPGIALEDDDDDDDVTHETNGGGAVVPQRQREVSAAGKTLADAKFVVGDYLSVAVLPPDERTGEVAPAVATVDGVRGRGMGGFGSAVAAPAPGGGGRGRGRGWRGGREWDGGHGRGRDRDGHSFPEGEWRRGERVPEGARGGRRGSRW